MGQVRHDPTVILRRRVEDELHASVVGFCLALLRPLGVAPNPSPRLEDTIRLSGRATAGVRRVRRPPRAARAVVPRHARRPSPGAPGGTRRRGGARAAGRVCRAARGGLLHRPRVPGPARLGRRTRPRWPTASGTSASSSSGCRAAGPTRWPAPTSSPTGSSPSGSWAHSSRLRVTRPRRPAWSR